MPHDSGPSAGRTRITVVEDDLSMALLLAYNLETAGHIVSIVESGALDDIERTRPDVMILDWELPGLSGIEVLRQIRRRLAPDYVPVVMLTGRNGRDDRNRAFDTGADVFLSKPFAMTELMQHVTTLLERHACSPNRLSAESDNLDCRT